MISYTIARTSEGRFNVPTAQWVCSECGGVVERQDVHNAFHARLDGLTGATPPGTGSSPDAR